jgi:hypothetical protein
MRIALSRLHVLIAATLALAYGLWTLHAVIATHSAQYLIAGLLFVAAAAGAYMSRRWAAYLMLVLAVVLSLGYLYLALVRGGVLEPQATSAPGSGRAVVFSVAHVVVATYCAIVSYKYVGRDRTVA